MNFSEKVKAELRGVKFKTLDEARSFLSAYIRSGGSVCSVGGQVGFEIPCDETAAKCVESAITLLYGAPERVEDLKRGNRVRFIERFINEKSLDALVDMRIVERDDEGVALKINIDDEIADDETRAAYVRGIFLGCGSVTAPSADGTSSTGYHLEFAFANYQTATDFCEILSEAYFMPKLTGRKETYVVYFKTIDEITDLLAFMGANKAVLDVSELAVEKAMRNDMNRKINCEMSNMVKQMDASVKQIRAINKIDSAIGIGNLPDGLRAAAEARLKNKDRTLSEIAEDIGVTKSCLNHRYRKIIEIAENL